MQHDEDRAQLGQKITQLILSSCEAETMLLQMLQMLGEAFQVDCCLASIKSKNQEGTTETDSWCADVATPLALLKPLPSLANLAKLLPTDAPLVIDDITADTTSSFTEWRNSLPSARAILYIPIWFQGKLDGLVSLLHYQPHYWSELEKQLAMAVEPSLALAISHVAQARLVVSLQQQVRTSAQSKALLNRLSMASRSSLELNQILQLALTGTAQALEVTRGFILLLKYVDPLLRTRARERIPKAKATVVCEWLQDGNLSGGKSQSQSSSLLDQSFWLSECLLCQQALTNSPSPIAIDEQNNLSCTDSTSNIAPIFQLSQFSSLLMLPLENQGTVLGFIVLQDSRDRRWQSEELALVDLVSGQISTTIIQNQTLRQVQSLVEERTAQLQRSLEVQGKLYEKTRQQIDQLRQLNQLKDEFLSTMSHELRTPLTSMNLAIRMLRQPGITAERQVKYLDILEQQCTQEISLINDLLKLQQLESQQAPLKLETIDIKTKIQDLAQASAQAWADKGLSIKLDLPRKALPVQTDAESFERILQELLTNAGKYSNPDTTVVLKVFHQVDQQVNQIVLSLCNIGAGIAPEDIDYIFDKFRRGKGVTQQAIQGTGLGLALVKCLVQHLSGSIVASSNAIDNSDAYETCFTLALPQFFCLSLVSHPTVTEQHDSYLESDLTTDGDDIDVSPELDAHAASLAQAVEVQTEEIAQRQRQITAKIYIPQPVEQVWQVLTDYEVLADFIPNLAKSRRLDRPAGGIRLEQVGTQRLLRFNFSARVVLDLEEKFPHEIQFNMVEGDFRGFSGKWLLEPYSLSQQGTNLCYIVRVWPKRTMPVVIIERRLSTDMRLNLLAIRRRVEELFGMC